MAAALSGKARGQSRQNTSTGLPQRAKGGAIGSGAPDTAGREPQAPAVRGSQRPARAHDQNAQLSLQKRRLQSGALAGQSEAGGEGQDAAGEPLRQNMLPDPTGAATRPAAVAGANEPVPPRVVEQLLRTGQLVWSAEVAGRLLALLREQLLAAAVADGAQGSGLDDAVLVRSLLVPVPYGCTAVHLGCTRSLKRWRVPPLISWN